MRRMGRPGLVGTMARTAVVVGTASAVSGGTRNRQEEKQEAKQQQAAAAAPAAAVPAPEPAVDDPMEKVKQLGELHAQGLLTDEEFSAAKAKALGI